jgi:hypothetical protein
VRKRKVRTYSKIFLDPYGATLTKHILGGTRQARRATQEQSRSKAEELAPKHYTAEKHSLWQR